MNSNEPLVGALFACRVHLPAAFAEAHARLFEPEPLEVLARRLREFQDHGPPDAFPPPRLVVEETPAYPVAFEPFRGALEVLAREPASEAAHLALAAALVAAGTRHILVLLGQRQTPGSVVDARALPPPRRQLLEAAARPLEGELSTAGRALTKHVPRVADGFWGEVRGSDAEKSRAAMDVVQSLFERATWWNVFEHYKHGIVFEVREPGGHGARWGGGGTEFIGFLEPFTPNFPLERT